MTTSQTGSDNSVEASWWISSDGLNFRSEEYQDFAVGQIMDFAVYARVQSSAPSDEPVIRLGSRGHEYVVNARILSVTLLPGGTEDLVCSVLDFGLKARTYDKVYEGVLEQSNYWVSAQMGLGFELHGRGERDWVPLARHLTHKWQIERIYKSVLPPDDERGEGPCGPTLTEVPEARLTNAWERICNRSEGDTEPLWSLLLKCRRLGPADAVVD